MSEDFERLINKDEYQVFLFYCPAYFPFSFFKHPWFVLNKKGVISRWEVRHIKNKENNNYLYKNFQKPFEGVQMTFFIKKYWQAKLLKQVNGPVAEKIIEYIENSESSYPYADRYILTGPNSNTYVKWALNQFPEFDTKLNWKFIGRNYELK